jgi:hypothetical protein
LRKRAHASYEAARTELRRIIGNNPMTAFTMVTYYCQMCDNFHNGNSQYLEYKGV